MTTEWLTEHGFIVKHLFGKWYLVRLYANKDNLLHHIVFPMRLFHGDTGGGRVLNVPLRGLPEPNSRDLKAHQ